MADSKKPILTDRILSADLFNNAPADLPLQNRSTTLQTLLDNEKKEREREREFLLEQLDDLKKDRDHWRHQASMLLTHQPEPAKHQEASLLWKKLFGRKN